LTNDAANDVSKIEAARQLRPIIRDRLIEFQNQPEPTGRKYFVRRENERRAEEEQSLRKVKDSLDRRLTVDYAFDCLKDASGEVSRKNQMIAVQDVTMKQMDSKLHTSFQFGHRGKGTELHVTQAEHIILHQRFSDNSPYESFAVLDIQSGPRPTPFWSGVIRILQRIADHLYWGETVEHSGTRKDEIQRLLTCNIVDEGESAEVSILFDNLTDHTVNVKTSILHYNFHLDISRNGSATVGLAWLASKAEDARKAMMPAHLEHWHEHSGDHFAWFVGSCGKLGAVKVWAGQLDYIPVSSSTFFEVAPDFMDAQYVFKLLEKMACADNNIETYVRFNKNHELVKRHTKRVIGDRGGDADIDRGWEENSLLLAMLKKRREEQISTSGNTSASNQDPPQDPLRTPPFNPLKRTGPVGVLDRSPQKHVDFLNPPWDVDKLQGEWQNDYGMKIRVDAMGVLMRAQNGVQIKGELVVGISNILLYVDQDCYFLLKSSPTVKWLFQNNDDNAVAWHKPVECKPASIKKLKVEKENSQKKSKKKKKRLRRSQKILSFSPKKNRDSDDEWDPRYNK